MSHYTEIETEIREPALLVRALAEMGYQKVECHEEPQHLYGYQGDVRPEKAEVIIRRKHVGRASNDVGFQKQEAGTYQAIISEYDRRQNCNQAWLQQLNNQYAYQVVKEQAEEQDLVWEEERVLENGDRVIVLSERG